LAFFLCFGHKKGCREKFPSWPNPGAQSREACKYTLAPLGHVSLRAAVGEREVAKIAVRFT